MEDSKKKNNTPDTSDKDIVFSKSIKAGKRIYYLDVKKNRKDEMYLAITESKRISPIDSSEASFEKHKIFLYREDFDKFTSGLTQAISYINNKKEKIEEFCEDNEFAELAETEKIKFDIDFE